VAVVSGRPTGPKNLHDEKYRGQEEEKVDKESRDVKCDEGKGPSSNRRVYQGFPVQGVGCRVWSNLKLPMICVRAGSAARIEAAGIRDKNYPAEFCRAALSRIHDGLI
jgi:hypothetical protein